MNNVYSRGNLNVMVNTDPKTRDLMWACSNNGIILIPVVFPAHLPYHMDSYFAGWLDSKGFSEADEKQRKKFFMCIVPNLEEMPDEMIVDTFLNGMTRRDPGFIKSLNGDDDNFLLDIEGNSDQDVNTTLEDD